MTLAKMVKEIIIAKEVEIRCSECGLKFKYPKNDFYYPKTCSFKCEYKRQHPELAKRTK